MPRPSVRVAIVVGSLVLAYFAVGLGSAVTSPAEIVEGHTVFVSISNMTGIADREGFAAAVAILVRDQGTPLVGRFPGVLWFNDQYLVDPDVKTGNQWTRYPCTGVVIAVELGEPDPRANGALTGDARYEESYRITDPNDRAWDIDRWNITGGKEGGYHYAWTVAMGNRGETSTVPDDGESSCDPVIDRGCPLPLDETACYQPQPFYGEGPDPEAPDPTDPQAACAPPECGSLRYNALLFFWLDDLKRHGAPVDHTNASGDVPGCHEADPELGCPGGDDDAEGDSHRVFDPLAAPDVEPGSADCTGDGRDDEHCHATARIDLYYGTAPVPLQRNYVLFDGAGREEALGCTEISAALGVCLP